MKITPDNQSLFGLVEKAQKGQLVLPEFQRSFVWPYADVKDLLISIFKGYFIGSILLQDADSKSLPFAYRTIEGVADIASEDTVQKYILDGQQRITTLHYVLYAPQNVNLKYTSSPYRFFLNLVALMKDDLENAIYGERERDVRRLIENKELQFEKKTVPFTALTQAHWNAWQAEYMSSADDAIKPERAMEVLAWQAKLQPFFNFTVATLQIDKVKDDDADGIAEICAVFEKMNSKGVKLTVFDLLTARLYRSNIALRQLWREARQQHENISHVSDEDPDIYAIFILRIIALLRGLDVKSSTLINLSADNFETDFVVAATSLDKALARIKSTQGYGAFDTKWIPYPGTAVTLGALIHISQSERLDATSTRAIDKWYWGSVFGERYSSAVESTTTSDFRDLRDYLMGKSNDSDVLARISQDLDHKYLLNKLYSTSRSGSSVYSGVMCLSALKGARDFRIDDAITLHTLDDHHIFPKNYLAKHYKNSDLKLTDSQINCVLNRTLISDVTNRKISNKAPSIYLNDPALIDIDQREAILRHHYINADGLNAMLSDDFALFQDARANQVIIDILEKVS
ncbi:DUF262 domain-containing protein [Candidatus Saccharibacteria bacterium]|nr:MAG: DUF262 domain-containing protein [Candidatus Saccharibacteria bacterium]